MDQVKLLNKINKLRERLSNLNKKILETQAEFNSLKHLLRHYQTCCPHVNSTSRPTGDGDGSYHFRCNDCGLDECK